MQMPLILMNKSQSSRKDSDTCRRPLCQQTWFSPIESSIFPLTPNKLQMSSADPSQISSYIVCFTTQLSRRSIKTLWLPTKGLITTQDRCLNASSAPVKPMRLQRWAVCTHCNLHVAGVKQNLNFKGLSSVPPTWLNM